MQVKVRTRILRVGANVGLSVGKDENEKDFVSANDSPSSVGERPRSYVEALMTKQRSRSNVLLPSISRK